MPLDARPAFRPAIQGLRAVAVLMVVAYHARLPLPGGFTGVDVFFVISGFVIAEMLRREWSSTGRIDLVEFVRRRVRRLLPALATVVVVTVALSAVVFTPLIQPARTALTGLGGLLLSSNAIIAATTGDYFDEPAASNPLLHLWSLSVEEQFYLVLPVLLLVGWRRLRPGPLPMVLAATAVSFALMQVGPRVAAATPLPDALFGFYSPLVRAWEFLLGVILALTVRWRDLPARITGVLGAAGAGALIASAVLITPEVRFPGPVTLLPTLGTVLLIVAVEPRVGRLHDVLATRTAVAIGDRSYALYLWHWPLIVLAVPLLGDAVWIAVAAAALSIVPTLATHRYLEEPIRRRIDLPLRPLLVRTLVVPVGVVAGLAFGASAAWFQPPLADAAVQLNQRSLAQAAGCHGLTGLGPERFERCSFGDGHGRPIFLLGDSNASTAADAVIPAGAALERPVIVASGPACPFLTVGREMRTDACVDFVDELLAWLGTQPQGDVVIVNSDTYWFRSERVSPDVAAYGAVLEETVAAVMRSGHRPVLVQPIPVFDALAEGDPGGRWRLTDCSLAAFLRGGCGAAFELAETWPQQHIWRTTAAVARSNALPLVDATDRICLDGVCRTDRDGRWIYRDGLHLSAQKAAELVDLFTDALAEGPAPAG